MVRSSRVAVVAMVSLAGCFNPDDIFPLTGRVESIDPVEGQVVRLQRQNAVGRCDRTQASEFKQTTVDGGFFGFEVFRAEAQRLTDQGGFCFWAETIFPSGSTAMSELDNISGVTGVGVLRDWRAHPRLDGGVLEFDPPIPVQAFTDPDLPTLASLHQRATIRSADGGLIWLADDLYYVDIDGGLGLDRRPMVIDDARIEDFTGVVTLTARVDEQGDPNSLFGSTGTSTLLQSAQTLAVQGAQVPLSRGLPCAIVATPCPLTDGDLTAVVLAQNVSEVTFDLPRPAVLRAVVLRNVEVDMPSVVIDLIAEDGGSTRQIEALMPSESQTRESLPRLLDDGGVDFTQGVAFFTVIALDAGVPTSSVRLTFGGLTRAGEISIVGP
jgi:hypothetical protein